MRSRESSKLPGITQEGETAQSTPMEALFLDDQNNAFPLHCLYGVEFEFFPIRQQAHRLLILHKPPRPVCVLSTLPWWNSDACPSLQVPCSALYLTWLPFQPYGIHPAPAPFYTRGARYRNVVWFVHSHRWLSIFFQMFKSKSLITNVIKT